MLKLSLLGLELQVLGLELQLFAHGLEVLDFEIVLLGRQIFDQSLKSQGARVGCLSDTSHYVLSR